MVSPYKVHRPIHERPLIDVAAARTRRSVYGRGICQRDWGRLKSAVATRNVSPVARKGRHGTVVQRICFGGAVKPPGPVPVRLISRVATFIAEGSLVELHKPAMPGEKQARAMNQLGVDDVGRLEIIVSRTGTRSLGGIDLSRQLVQTFDGLDVF